MSFDKIFDLTAGVYFKFNNKKINYSPFIVASVRVSTSSKHYIIFWTIKWQHCWRLTKNISEGQADWGQIVGHVYTLGKIIDGSKNAGLTTWCFILEMHKAYDTVYYGGVGCGKICGKLGSEESSAKCWKIWPNVRKVLSSWTGRYPNVDAFEGLGPKMYTITEYTQGMYQSDDRSSRIRRNESR